MKRVLLLLWVAVIGIGCASLPVWVSNLDKWEEKHPKAFYAVGMSKNEDVVLRREEAQNAARAEMRLRIEAFVGYAAEAYRGDDRKAFAERTRNTFAEGKIRGVGIAKNYPPKPARDGIAYALARFNLEDAKNLIEASNELDRSHKDFLRREAGKLYERVRRKMVRDRSE